LNKKFFTLNELIVVIVVIGILAAIVMLNLSSWQVESKRTALISNERNVQTAVDHYHLDNGSYPTEIQPELGSPQLVDFEEVDTDYLRKEPKDGHYWIDEHGNVIVTIGIPPKNVNPSEEQVDWIESEGTESSKVYTVSPESGNLVIEPNVPFTDGLPLYKKEEGYNPTKNYFISAVDELGLETPKIGKDSKTVYPLDKDGAEDNEKAYEVFKLLGGSGHEEFKDAVEVSDGYVMLVHSTSTNGLFEGFTNKSVYVNWYLVKVDYNGNKVWVNKVDTNTHKVLHT
jgi:prepilin-type N-terminal cleavage/methylation domain-containing protein